MALPFPYHPATATRSRRITVRVVAVTKTATYTLVAVEPTFAPSSATTKTTTYTLVAVEPTFAPLSTSTETTTYTLVAVEPTSAPSPTTTPAPSPTTGSTFYVNNTGAVILVIIWGSIVIVLILYVHKVIKMTKPKRQIKPTAKAQAGYDSSDGDDDLDDLGTPNTTKTAKAKPKNKAKPQAKNAKGKDSKDELALTDDEDSDWEDEIEFLTTDPKSPFVKLDLVTEFLKPDFQALLTAEDKKQIADLLPDHINLTADGQLPEDFVRYNPDFRSAVRQYQIDLEAGRYDPAWLAEAAQAMEERAQGKFDQWKEEQFEEFWGQKQKVDPKALAGQSTTVKLHRLIEADLCKVGDVWSYSRVFGQGKKTVLVEKEFKLTEIEGDALTFAIPPGTAKFARRLKEDSENTENPHTVESHTVLPATQAPASPASDSGISSIPSDVEDYIPVSVTSLASLEEKIVAIDGKFRGNVNGNAWKSIRIKRQEQDLGSLFDIRENFFVYGKTA